MLSANLTECTRNHIATYQGHIQPHAIYHQSLTNLPPANSWPYVTLFRAARRLPSSEPHAACHLQSRTLLAIFRAARRLPSSEPHATCHLQSHTPLTNPIASSNPDSLNNHSQMLSMNPKRYPTCQLHPLATTQPHETAS